METDSGILAWRIPMDRGAWGGCSPWGRKELDTAEATKHTAQRIFNQRTVVIIIIIDETSQS